MLGIVSIAVLQALTPVGALGQSYFIEESTDFTGNGCPNTDLNDVTSSLRTSLDNNSWSGTRYVNSAAWPQDFMESCDSSYGNGYDGSYGDTQDLAVYAGHGNAGFLQWGFPHNSRCSVDFSSNMRLGSMDGELAKNAMYLTSCTLKTDSLVAEANWMWLWQQFGFHNSPVIGDDQPRDFFDATDTTPNVDAWLAEMDDPPGTTVDNSPIVVSYGETEYDATYVRNYAHLRAGWFAHVDRAGGPACTQGQPAFYYNWVMIDNGTSAACW